MGKIAFVFSGQGDQYSGMGSKLCEKYPAAARVFKICDGIRSGTSAQCFSGSEEELKETKNTQPCLFAYEAAAAAVLTENGIKADMTAGFSLGEVTALAFSGAVSLETGFSLVFRRGELMADAAQKYPAKMAAVVRLENDEVSRIASGFENIYPVNFNCPGQVTVAGAEAEMKDFADAVKAAGGRALPLKVSGGFHSPFMSEAAALFKNELEKVPFEKPAIPLYSDVTALPYEGNEAEMLSRQICSPVLWEKLILNMIEAGADTFIEIGPGNTLCGLISKIDKNVRVYTASELEKSGFPFDEVKSC